MLDMLNVLKSSSECEIVYAARSIPFYHLVSQPELAYLNLYIQNNALHRVNGSFEAFYGNFSMYNCSVDLENNSMLTRKGNRLSLFIGLHSFNFIETYNEELCGAALQWSSDLISKSAPVSGESSLKQRIRFFEKAKSGIDELVRKVKTG